MRCNAGKLNLLHRSIDLLLHRAVELSFHPGRRLRRAIRGRNANATPDYRGAEFGCIARFCADTNFSCASSLARGWPITSRHRFSGPQERVHKRARIFAGRHADRGSSIVGLGDGLVAQVIKPDFRICDETTSRLSAGSEKCKSPIESWPGTFFRFACGTPGYFLSACQVHFSPLTFQASPSI